MRSNILVVALSCIAISLTSSLVMAESRQPEAAAPSEISSGLLGPSLRSSNLERSIEFYTKGLGMTHATTLKLGSVTEAIFCYGPPRTGTPVISIYKDDAPGKSQPIEHGNGFDLILVRTDNAEAFSKRLVKAGYAVGEMQSNPKEGAKFFMVHDPDGYEFEIAEVLTK